MPDEWTHLLRAFHRVMPGVAGVVLSDESGIPLAHDLSVDPSGVAAAALRQRHAGSPSTRAPGGGTLVDDPSGTFLVVFMPDASSW